MPSFKTFHFSCSPHEGGVIDISPLSLTQKCIPLKSQLFEGSNSYQTPHAGRPWALSAVPLPLGHKENQSSVSQGSVNALGVNTVATLHTFRFLPAFNAFFALDIIYFLASVYYV